MTCTKCGASLAAGAQFCLACGQSAAAVPPKVAAPRPAGAGKQMPVAALIVLIGGLALLLGAFWLYQSGNFPGTAGTAAPAAGAPEAQPAPVPEPPASAPVSPADPPAAAAPGAAATAPVQGQTAAGAPAAAPTALAPAPTAAAPPAPPPPPPPPFEKTYECRKYVAFKIDPDTAIVTVDGEIIGIADEWADTPRTKKYEFKSPGIHYVKLSHRDYKTIWLRFIVSDKADDKTAEVELEMKKEKDRNQE